MSVIINPTKPHLDFLSTMYQQITTIPEEIISIQTLILFNPPLKFVKFIKTIPKLINKKIS
ncbi:MAG: hypothetical protein HRS50_02030 [Mycoplasmataceae bacterium]|nr:hypothetical protein [Mycoplasmataceae bacterium]